MNSVEISDHFSDKQSVALMRIAMLEREIEQDSNFSELLSAISKGTGENYVEMARRLFPHLISSFDAESVIRSAISNIAVRNLTVKVRKAHADRMRVTFTPETARKAGLASQQSPNSKKTFDRAEQIRSALTRGDRPWPDSEEFVLIALARKLKQTRQDRLQTDWEAVAQQMNMIFQTNEFERLMCRRHGLAIFERDRKGTYGRGMPATNADAYQRAINFLQPPENGVDAVTARTISCIQSLLQAEVTSAETTPEPAEELASVHAARELLAAVERYQALPPNDGISSALAQLLTTLNMTERAELGLSEQDFGLYESPYDGLRSAANRLKDRTIRQGSGFSNSGVKVGENGAYIRK